MEVFLVFNELSNSRAAPDVATGKKYLDGFGELLLDQRIKGKRILVSPPGFLQSQVGPGYPVGRWLKETKDEPARTRLTALFDRRKEHSELAEGGLAGSDDIEYRCDGELAQGLSLAFLIEGLAVSFRSSDRWDVIALNLEKAWLSDGSLETSVVSARHACRPIHIQSHDRWLLTKQQEAQPSSGKELWDARAEMFPSLDFCDSAGDQIRDLFGGELRFKAVLRGLRDLQKYCEEWETPHFDIHQLVNASGESGPTLKMYSQERTFRCRDGEYRVFEWHLKRGDNTRIHFLDLPGAKRILVGYVGPHLPISGQ